MGNKFKLEGTALFVKHRITTTGKQVINFMIECQNEQGYTGKIPVTCWHDGQNMEHLLENGQHIAAIGSLRNAPVKNKDGSTTFKLEAVVTDFKTTMQEVASGSYKQAPVKQAPKQNSFTESTLTEQDVPF